MIEGMVQIVVRADSLVDDDALLIASFMCDVPEQLDLVDLLQVRLAEEKEIDRRIAAVLAYLREADSISWTPAPRGRSGCPVLLKVHQLQLGGRTEKH